jgi:hypothetical protein
MRENRTVIECKHHFLSVRWLWMNRKMIGEATYLWQGLWFPVYLYQFVSFVYTCLSLVRDSFAVRRLFVRLAGAVGRRSTLHKENSRFAAPTPGRHISTFRGYRILFSPGVGAANLLFSLWRVLRRPTAPASRTKSRRTAKESRTNDKHV